MYTFHGTYFHPWWHPRECQSREELLALLATDERWRETPYTPADWYRLRAELAQQQEQARVAEHAALVAEARNPTADRAQELPSAPVPLAQAPTSGREWPSFLEGYLAQFGVRFPEGTRVIEKDRQAIVITPGKPWADTYLWLGDGSFQWSQQVLAADVMPGGWIRYPPPPVPLSGMGSGVPLPPKKKHPAALDLMGSEWKMLPPSGAVTPESEAASRGRRGRQKGGGAFYGHEVEVMEHVIKLVKQWRINAQSNASLKKDPLQKEICMASVWTSIASSFSIHPDESTLYHCLKVYGKTIGKPEMIWKTFLDSISP